VSELVLQAVVDGPLLGLNARFGAGSFALLGVDAAALANLVVLVAGARAPRRGVVLFDGTPLHANPELRRATAALFADEPLPALGSVSAALQAIFAARAERRDPRALLETAGLADWGPRRPRDLDASERRTLSLVVALGHPHPRLLALYEPFAAGRGLDANFVREGVARALGAGAIVVFATQSLDDARSLGGIPLLLHAGALTNVANAPLGGSLDGDRSLVVETPDARRFAAALAGDASVRGVRWDEASAPDSVFVFGSDPERLASAVARVGAVESLRVRSVALSPLPLAALLAPPPGVFMAAQAAPYAAALPVPPPPFAQPPYGVGPGAAPEATAPSPPNQSVTMPTSFADPTRPGSGGGT
jgi:ABC-type thiamine transport system ATPase subunit